MLSRDVSKYVPREKKKEGNPEEFEQADLREGRARGGYTRHGRKTVLR